MDTRDIKAIVAVHYYVHTPADGSQFMLSECLIASADANGIADAINICVVQRANQLSSQDQLLLRKVNVRGRVQSVTIIPNG